MKKIVIKIGTNVLAHETGELNHDVINNIVLQVIRLMKQQTKVVLVTSGAMGAGREILKGIEYDSEIEKRQVLASVGQSYLMSVYNEAFSKHGMKAAQILLTRKDFSNNEHQYTVKGCIDSLWKHNIIPIINENDATSIEELMFTDNDQLSSLVSYLIDADQLCILTNVDGVYDRHPDDKQATLISSIHVEQTVEQYIDSRKSDFGRGGMLTKVLNAQKLARFGVNVCIMNGKTNDLEKFINGSQVGTTVFSETDDNIKVLLNETYEK